MSHWKNTGGKAACTYCGYEDSRVVDSRGTWRRRECLNPECLSRFSTYEVVARFQRDPKHRPRLRLQGSLF
jgi:hypothetical protein